jgi:hypothetical protein
MKARFDVGTDVAMIGAWDEERGAQPFSDAEYARLSDTLDAEATQGHIFVLRTGGDGGGPVDVYVDEPVPPEAIERLTPIGEDLILALPSGTLDVDGVEYYRPKKPVVTRAGRVVALPPGDYTLRCYTAKDAEDSAPSARAERDLESVIGAEDLRYYERTTRAGCLTGLLLLLLFPALFPFFGWKVAFGDTAVAFVGYFIVREWLLRRNDRFARLRERVTAFRRGREGPTFVLELRKIGVRFE